jgi:type IX secretion system PorP/SprF family membrane protein
MLKRLVYIIFLMGIVSPAYSQLQPLLDQHKLNGLAINPAYAGSKEALNIELNSRNQWLGFEGAPSTYTVSIHSPLRNKKVNLGLMVLGDKLGSKRETGFLMNYAYRMDLGKGKWSLGLAAGISNLSIDLNSVRYIDLGDMLLQNPERSKLLPEFSIGTYYYTEKYFVGISMPLFLSHFTDEDNGQYKLSLNLSSVNYMLSAGYLFFLSEGIDLMPSVLLKTNPASATQLDMHCDLILREKIWIGTGVRTSGSMSALLQLQVNPQLKIGYSYAYELSELRSYQHGSHEVILQYSFRYLLEVMSPRYF